MIFCLNLDKYEAERNNTVILKRASDIGLVKIIQKFPYVTFDGWLISGNNASAFLSRVGKYVQRAVGCSYNGGGLERIGATDDESTADHLLTEFFG